MQHLSYLVEGIHWYTSVRTDKNYQISFPPALVFRVPEAKSHKTL